MKDLSSIKGILKGWTQTSAEWYDLASEYTGYHDRLLEHLIPLLKPEDHCCEIACGTGALARKVAPHVSSYTANDVDASALSFLKNRLMEPGSPNIRILEGDWQEVLAGRHYDVVLASYYGVPVALWPDLCSIVSRRFIAICPRDEQWRKKRRGRETPDQRVLKLETPAMIRDFCDNQGIPFVSQPLDLEFGQPFRSRHEAEAYIRYYYRLEGADISRFIDQKLCIRDGILYFPKKKEIEIISMDLTGFSGKPEMAG